MQIYQADNPGQKLELPVPTFRAIIGRASLTLFRGYAPLTSDELIVLCTQNSECELLHWSFGPVMELKVESQPVNYLFSNEPVPFHWDGAFHQVPSFLVFNCIEAPPPNSGGETTFVDTQEIVEQATPEELRLWSNTQLTYETEKKAHYGGAFTTPMIQKHPRTARSVLRFAEPVETQLNPVVLRVEGAGPEVTQKLLAQMKAKLYDPKRLYVHSWESGDLLVADNHALLHGRNAIKKNTPRHIRRIQIL